METRCYTIPASRKQLIEEQFAKLNKRARKLEIDEITWQWGQAVVETRSILAADPNFPESEPRWVERKVLCLPIVVSGPLVVAYDGWQFIATIQHLQNAGNIIRSISDEFDIPKHYRDAASDCEHCQVRRYRKDTYLVHHEDGSIVQVGSSCIKDFLGGNSPDNLIGKANFISELLSFMDGMSLGYGGSGDLNYHIHEFLAQTSAVIREHGWMSKSKAEENLSIPTAMRVEENLDVTKRGKEFVASVVNDSDKERGIAATEWAENISDTECDKSDYLYNIRTIARSGLVGKRTMGYAASIMSGYDRYLGDLAKPRVPSQHVGTVKKRQIFELTLTRTFTFDGMYGTSHKYVFVDEAGNVLVWSTSNRQELSEGKKYGIKGTIKSHDEYKGVKQTQLSRCEVMVSYDVDS